MQNKKTNLQWWHEKCLSVSFHILWYKTALLFTISELLCVVVRTAQWSLCASETHSKLLLYLEDGWENFCHYTMHDTEGIAQLFSHKNQILCWTESAPSVEPCECEWNVSGEAFTKALKVLYSSLRDFSSNICVTHWRFCDIRNKKCAFKY